MSVVVVVVAAGFFMAFLLCECSGELALKSTRRRDSLGASMHILCNASQQKQCSIF